MSKTKLKKSVVDTAKVASAIYVCVKTGSVFSNRADYLAFKAGQ
jgi:hypothetical protein